MSNVDNVYTQPIIKGVKYTKMMPEGCALVLEGGGIRGFYSAGVFEAFMDAGLMFPYVISVSAGSANALSYITGQQGRNRQIVEKYLGDHRYLSYRNLLRHGSLFGFDYILDTVPNKHIFWDREVFDGNEIRFLTGAADCDTGETVWFEKHEITHDFKVIRASCSLPFISKVVAHNGYTLMDGGLSSPIPIEKSIADGNSFHIVVLTRNIGYTKLPYKHSVLLKLFYGKYPKLIDTILKRHEVYNRQLAICEQLEKEGRAIIIRPLLPLKVDRITKDIKEVLELYDEGHKEGEVAVRLLKERFDLA